MRRTLCKSKIHRATLTGADLHYEGSCTVDRDLMDAADLLPFEKVQVVNVNTGARLETYIIEGERGSGTVQLNGAAARLGMPGDLVIIISYAEYDEDEVDDAFTPRIVFVDAHNRRVVPASREEFEEGRHEA
jgi:aspartate 1-decarboxylase